MKYIEREKLSRLRRTFDNNYKITQLYSLYLERFPEAITEEMVNTLCEGGNIEKADAVSALVCEILGLDFEKEDDRFLIRNYITPSIRLLDEKRYTEDKYYKNIKIGNKKIGNWEFRRESYKPYRAVICDDITILPDFTEIPPLGFFTKEFYFPAVLEDGNEWMTLTPVDMDTCTEAIAAAHGRVLTFGLGLGYYAYMVSEKAEVDEVVVVERSADVIKLFCDELLPQMPNRHKIKIVQSDAFEYAKRIMPKENFDLVFVDIWRDGSDGAEMYRRMKPYEASCTDTRFMYWIEGFIISRLRALKFEELWAVAESGGELTYDEILSRLVDKQKLIKSENDS